MTRSSPEYSAATHPGLKRDNNEDCFLSIPEVGLWVVADGMGGHEAGEVASAIVSNTLEKLARRSTPFSLNQSIQTAHKDILQAVERGIGAAGMGSTVVALLSQDTSYQIGWVGDSRAYLWNKDITGGHLSRLTTDHSYVQMLFTAGAIAEQDIDNHPDKNVITQCLGMQELNHVNVDVIEGLWQKNQWILLCSDGLSDELNDDTIAKILSLNTNSLTAVDQLLQQALSHGGNDNITLQIIESPVKEQHYRYESFWQWIPQMTPNRSMDACIFACAMLFLLALLFVTLN